MAEDIENWLTSGISCLTKTKDPKEIKKDIDIDRKSKPSLNMAQKILWSVLLRTAGIFGSFVRSTNESILEQL